MTEHPEHLGPLHLGPSPPPPRCLASTLLGAQCTGAVSVSRHVHVNPPSPCPPVDIFLSLGALNTVTLNS